MDAYDFYYLQECKAEQSLRWLRGAPPPGHHRHCCHRQMVDRQMSGREVSAELATIHANIEKSQARSKDCKNVLLPKFLSPLGICCGMMVFLR